MTGSARWPTSSGWRPREPDGLLITTDGAYVRLLECAAAAAAAARRARAPRRDPRPARRARRPHPRRSAAAGARRGRAARRRPGARRATGRRSPPRAAAARRADAGGGDAPARLRPRADDPPQRPRRERGPAALDDRDQLDPARRWPARARRPRAARPRARCRGASTSAPPPSRCASPTRSASELIAAGCAARSTRRPRTRSPRSRAPCARAHPRGRTSFAGARAGARHHRPRRGARAPPAAARGGHRRRGAAGRPRLARAHRAAGELEAVLHLTGAPADTSVWWLHGADGGPAAVAAGGAHHARPTGRGSAASQRLRHKRLWADLRRRERDGKLIAEEAYEQEREAAELDAELRLTGASGIYDVSVLLAVRRPSSDAERARRACSARSRATSSPTPTRASTPAGSSPSPPGSRRCRSADRPARRDAALRAPQHRRLPAAADHQRVEPRRACRSGYATPGQTLERVDLFDRGYRTHVALITGGSGSRQDGRRSTRCWRATSPAARPGSSSTAPHRKTKAAPRGTPATTSSSPRSSPARGRCTSAPAATSTSCARGTSPTPRRVPASKIEFLVALHTLLIGDHTHGADRALDRARAHAARPRDPRRLRTLRAAPASGRASGCSTRSCAGSRASRPPTPPTATPPSPPSTGASPSGCTPTSTTGRRHGWPTTRRRSPTTRRCSCSTSPGSPTRWPGRSCSPWSTTSTARSQRRRARHIDAPWRAGRAVGGPRVRGDRRGLEAAVDAGRGGVAERVGPPHPPPRLRAAGHHPAPRRLRQRPRRGAAAQQRARLIFRTSHDELAVRRGRARAAPRGRRRDRPAGDPQGRVLHLLRGLRSPRPHPGAAAARRHGVLDLLGRPAPATSPSGGSPSPRPTATPGKRCAASSTPPGTTNAPSSSTTRPSATRRPAAVDVDAVVATRSNGRAG